MTYDEAIHNMRRLAEDCARSGLDFAFAIQDPADTERMGDVTALGEPAMLGAVMVNGLCKSDAEAAEQFMQGGRMAREHYRKTEELRKLFVSRATAEIRLSAQR